MPHYQRYCWGIISIIAWNFFFKLFSGALSLFCGSGYRPCGIPGCKGRCKPVLLRILCCNVHCSFPSIIMSYTDYISILSIVWWNSWNWLNDPMSSLEPWHLQNATKTPHSSGSRRETVKQTAGSISLRLTWKWAVENIQLYSCLKVWPCLCEKMCVKNWMMVLCNQWNE